MGAFRVSIEVGDPRGVEFREVSALVDTGASHTALPASLLRELGVQSEERWPFTLADGSQTERDVGLTWVRIDGRRRMTVVVFSPDDAPALLGAVTLEEFRLGVDPVARRVIPVPGLLLGAVREELEKVEVAVITGHLGKAQDLARYIAERVSHRTRDVRQAIHVAQLCNTNEEVDRFESGAEPGRMI